MYKISKPSLYSIALLSSMSLLMVVGCAGNESVKITTDVAQSENQESVESLPDNSMQEAMITQEIEPASVINSELAGNEPAQQVEEDKVADRPEEAIISFAFDQSVVMAEYGDLLWKHAEYLRADANRVIYISGHTDSSGARLYNEALSKKRSEEVAQILVDFGVSKDQIKTSGFASDQPLANAKSHREHRRVELSYQDQQLVSN